MYLRSHTKETDSFDTSLYQEFQTQCLIYKQYVMSFISLLRLNIATAIACKKKPESFGNEG